MVEATPDHSHRTQGAPAPPGADMHAVAARNGKPIRIDPDLDFIRSLNQRVGNTLNKCFQCGTCSATCELSSDSLPIPRKEMAWASWGMKEQLLNDPDLWLCYQCNDCSTRCPRGARPGDVLAALRQEAVIHHAFPRFFGRWANQPHFIPLLLGIPAALLTLALFLRDPLESALGISRSLGPRISYSYSNVLPHWLLNTLFLLIAFLAVLSMIGGVLRLWRSMRDTCGGDGNALRTKGFLASVGAALKSGFGARQVFPVHSVPCPIRVASRGVFRFSCAVAGHSLGHHRSVQSAHSRQFHISVQFFGVPGNCSPTWVASHWSGGACG